MTKPYRIKHKASGLYYQPASNHNNLTKNGKVYMTNNSPLMLNNSYDYISISVRKGTKVHNILEKLMPLKGMEEFFGKAVYYCVPKSEFEKEELQLMKSEDIKFKGKVLNSGEWVIGDLLHRITDTCIAVKDMDDIIYYPIDPATVCQFTGLKDCEENEVWEGDIVEFETYDLYKGNVKTEAVIEYISSGYVAVTDGIPYSLCTKCIKVVGNKFDKEK